MLELKKINWTTLLIGIALGASAVYFYQKYAAKD
jgi:hypothetical protein